MQLAFSMSDPLKTFNTEHLQKIEKNISRLETIVQLQSIINKMSDSSFLYWHQSMLPIYLKNCMEQNVDLMRLTVSVFGYFDFLKGLRESWADCWVEFFMEKFWSKNN